MFFEGSEKKVEMVTAPEAGSLRALGKDFWAGVVAKAQAEILDTISNEHCDAYLLSESSLFVWHDRFLMLTCGTTTLVDATLYFLDHFPLDHILFASFQRKNEYQSHLQKSTFEEDIDRLSKRLEGPAFRLGHLDSHHNYVFHLDKPYQPEADDNTSELLMYHIKGENAEYLRAEGQTVEGIRKLLRLDDILPDFEISDWLFEPFGYSLNAIKGDRYATFHITPQEDSSYVSFETNMDLQKNPVVPVLLEALNPGCWDLIGFNANQVLPEQHDYLCMSRCDLPLNCGYDMRFRHYQHSGHATVKAEKL
ncbi:adenosylmethionine decarboxylase [Endozoicomonas montiporae]|uniref:Adenosylmethionine decarboxylase n=2 Tax=Endozoicomonas montiporae TaxID=1027273 RepID=A0A081N085_9GAMM|nr:adenosylmethionine decarboxylase [Endozoicomonas montiporae]AMO54311.1 adenosylmethionine decarboxylase [Endozoicomonas montiporae CL-33]KEQ11858.1 adenosylmethionine decarboxylase [Endozoicomonas montiporae]